MLFVLNFNKLTRYAYILHTSLWRNSVTRAAKMHGLFSLQYLVKPCSVLINLSEFTVTCMFHIFAVQGTDDDYNMEWSAYKNHMLVSGFFCEKSAPTNPCMWNAEQSTFMRRKTKRNNEKLQHSQAEAAKCNKYTVHVTK